MKSDLQKPKKWRSTKCKRTGRILGVRELEVDEERVSDEEAHMPT